MWDRNSMARAVLGAPLEPPMSRVDATDTTRAASALESDKGMQPRLIARVRILESPGTPSRTAPRRLIESARG